METIKETDIHSFCKNILCSSCISTEDFEFSIKFENLSLSSHLELVPIERLDAVEAGGGGANPGVPLALAPSPSIHHIGGASPGAAVGGGGLEAGVLVGLEPRGRLVVLVLLTGAGLQHPLAASCLAS